MASSLAFLTIFSLLLVGSAVGGRKEAAGESWRDAARKCGDDVVKGSDHKQDDKSTVWIYPDAEGKLVEEKSFVKEVEMKANNNAAYHDDEKPFEDDFEPRPNLSVYND